MKSIISVNRKFMKLLPNELLDLISNNSKYTKGVEISIDFLNEEEFNYLDQIAFECKKRDMHFQVHGDSGISLEDQLKVISKLETISDQIGYPIHIVLHPFLDVEETINYMNNITDNINNDKIIISLENLNDLEAIERLHKREVIPIIANNCNVYMTYDMGHEMIDYSDATDFDTSLMELITNIHLHTHNTVYSDGYDHKPIFKGDTYWLNVLKCIEFLKVNKYDGPVVFEYDLYACRGNTLEEQIKSYLESIDFVSEHLI